MNEALRLKSSPDFRRAGITLIEVLVVIAIIAVLVAIFLPAIQMAREAARRTQCGNNLRQLGLATFNYESANRSLPPGQLHPQGLMWSAYLLPFLEQEAAFSRLDWEASFPRDNNRNVEVAGIWFSIFQCPSQSVPRLIDQHRMFEQRGPSTYNACASGLLMNESGPPPYPGDPRSTDGLFGTNVLVRLKEVTDGTSSTIMFGESVFEIETTGLDLAEEPEIVDHWYVVSAEMSPAPEDDSGDVSEGFSSTAIQMNQHKNKSAFIDHQELCFGSRHPGGTMVVYADGHVQFVSESIHPAIWSALGTKSRDEITYQPN